MPDSTLEDDMAAAEALADSIHVDEEAMVRIGELLPSEVAAACHELEGTPAPS